jgi:beta-mannanase
VARQGGHRSCLRQRFPARWLAFGVAFALALSGAVAADASAATASNAKRVCAYSQHSISKLQKFSALIGRHVDCAQVFDYGTQSWAEWEQPWFIRNVAADINWQQWATALGTDRQLIIAQSLIPDSEKNNPWRRTGATGAYADHARALARNLVAAGLGDAIIRLAPEANGDWNLDAIGSTDADMSRWRQTWREMVLAMRSVPGAHFRFDWCINNGYRSIAFTKYYPGDDVVDIIGDDAYDSGVPSGQDRWTSVFQRAGGLASLVAFADAHDKPLSFPEWGVAAASVGLSGGDDPAYVDNIAGIVRSHTVAYQSYFYARDWETQLSSSSRSLAAYRRHFGADGDALAGSAGSTADAPPAASSDKSSGLPAPSATQSPLAPTPAVLPLTTPAAPTTPAKSKVTKKKVVKKARRTSSSRKASRARAKAKAKAKAKKAKQAKKVAARRHRR